jgi:Domain of unknown function (DUF1772)
MKKMKNLILFGSIAVASGLLFVNIYTSLIDAKSWGSDLPNSIATARAYFKTTNPGNFFRVFSPLNQVLALLTLILFWKVSPSARLYLGIAVVMYVLGDVMTFAYFYPRNDIMFRTAELSDAALLKKVWSEWTLMNWVRSFVILTGIVFSFLSIHKIYSLYPKKDVSSLVSPAMDFASA